VPISTIVNSLKGVSARYLRQEYSAHLHRYLAISHQRFPR
jgi:REP element-mobilizing transposase RayT